MSTYLDALLQIVREPTSNLTAAALLVAGVVLVALILIVLILIVLLPGGRKKPSTMTETGGARSGSPASEPALMGRLNPTRRIPLLKTPTLFILGAACLLGAGAYSYVVSSSDTFCSEACHTMEPAAATWSTSDHQNTSCVRCHEGTPWLSAPLAAASRVRYIAASWSNQTPNGATVPSDRCLACHPAIEDQSVETSSGIRMSHREPLAAGIPCASCHDDVGHARAYTGRASVMQRCLVCHDGTTAAAVCATCHVTDPGKAPIAKRLYQKTRLAEPTCGGCHDQASCDRCHGLRMPHSAAFIAGGHAMPAAFDRKPLCYRCHTPGDCGRCHGQFEAAHGGPAFKAEHQKFAWDSPCNTCHPNHEGSFCYRCHTKR